MTIDDRLDRLTERHEALTQTVEIIASMQKENERRVGSLTEAVSALVRIVESHERRLDNLDNPGNLPPSPN